MNRFPSFLNPRAHSAFNTWATLWSFRGFSSKTQSSFILSTITEQWKFSYRIFTYIQNEIYPFWMDPYKLWFHCPLTIQKYVSQKSQNRLFCIKKIYHKKSTPGNRIGVACTFRLICAFVVHKWQNRFSHDVTHFQIDRSYLCHIRRKEFVASNFTVKKTKQKQTKNNNKKKKKKKKKKELLIYHSGCHFCRGFLENKFALNSSICVRNGTMRRFV